MWDSFIRPEGSYFGILNRPISASSFSCVASIHHNPALERTPTPLDWILEGSWRVFWE